MKNDYIIKKQIKDKYLREIVSRHFKINYFNVPVDQKFIYMQIIQEFTPVRAVFWDDGDYSTIKIELEAIK